MSVKVSVVIPFYNGSKYFPKALESVLNQSTKAFEIIVIDDGSSSAEHESLVQLCSGTNVKVIKTSNKGQSAARNHGVANANGDFVCFLDQDDYFLPNHISSLLQLHFANDFRAAFTYGDAWRQAEDGTVVAHTITSARNAPPHKNLKTLLGQDMFILPSASMISIEKFKEIGGFDESLQGYEDDDLFLRFFLRGFDSSYTSEAVTVWTINTNSVSFSPTMAKSRFTYYSKLLSAFPESGNYGVNVFSECIAPRFENNFIADIIKSAFKYPEQFQECKNRLRIHKRNLQASKLMDPNLRKIRIAKANIFIFSGMRTVRLLTFFSQIFSGISNLVGGRGTANFISSLR